ncbi:integrase core domain-containing protein, partial [Corynebacterium accolens]|uniref:integrase core domain-containing protein n=1 Tax=Corynebacterium accolens TaxID=38284 RepID=UPI00254D9725
APVPTTQNTTVPGPQNTGTKNSHLTVVEVEIATFEWVSWWNEVRLHQSLGYRTPAEVETELWKKNSQQGIIEIKEHA